MTPTTCSYSTAIDKIRVCGSSPDISAIQGAQVENICARITLPIPGTVTAFSDSCTHKVNLWDSYHV